ncbi:sugar transferase [Nevskia soli]|jgi:exopolysaccharide biosynthesis polyprenyl glycosylphosphotransferase|uniref:sugar transferase n=1 Tax=Nevskia soli TaxID=418856 RepID=UPI0015D69AB8|nr:sugar transferase [Nevskia soli]
MFSNQARKTRILFTAADLLLTGLAFEAAYATRLSLHFHHDFAVPSHALVLGFCVLTWMAAGWWLDVYSRLGRSGWRVILRDALRQAMLGTLGLLVFEFILRLDLSRFFLGLFAIYSSAFLLIFRLASVRLTGSVRRSAVRYVLVVGAGEPAERLGRTLEAAPGVSITGFLATGFAPLIMQLKQDYPVYPLSDLPRLLGAHVVDEILFAVESPELARLEDVFLLCDEEGVRTRVAVDFFPHVNSEIRLENLGETQLLTFSAAPDDDLLLLVKRAIDVSIAAVAILLGWPVMLLIAAAVRLSSPGPALFSQERCGLNGRRFRVYKFRSMSLGAEQRQSELLHLSRRQTAPKIPNDPRLTPIGRYLRRFSLDELPQLVNVLRGEMSLVGPRPAIPSEVAQYQRWQRRRLRMRPGLTCLWAVNGRDEVDFETWMKLDLEYIDNWSLGLDCKILLQTIPQVLSGRGAS